MQTKPSKPKAPATVKKAAITYSKSKDFSGRKPKGQDKY